MHIVEVGRTTPFRPWKEKDGPVFTRTFAFTCATAGGDDERPWLAPPFALGAAGDGKQGYFVTRALAPAFLAAHAAVSVAFHDAPPALDALNLVAPALDVYGRVDEGRAWDSLLLHRLHALATEGHTDDSDRGTDLWRCARLHLRGGPRAVAADGDGAAARKSYGRWINRDPGDIETSDLEALARDAVVTYALYRRLRKRLKEALQAGRRAWGYVSDDWLADQARRWGPATHHTQLNAAIVLRAVTANGLHTDHRQRDLLLGQVSTVAEEQRAVLRRHGYLPGQPGSDKALQAVLRRLERRHEGLAFPRTPAGQFATGEDGLAEVAQVEPFARALRDYRAAESLASSFVGKIGDRVLHPRFDVLKTTGRTSSFGVINAQNVPRDDRARRCFVPSPGHVFLDADYRAVEMVTLAQALLTQFGLRSALAEAINAGRDPHVIVAALATGKDEHDVTAADREKAKPINFGKPVGLGPATLRGLARAAYGVDLSEAEAGALSEAWLAAFPEMREFLGDGAGPGLLVARHLGLTPRSHADHTGLRTFVDHPAARGRRRRPNEALGWMCLKALGVAGPVTQSGRPYDAATLDYFWSMLDGRLGGLPAGLAAAARLRRPSAALRQAVLAEADAAPVWTLTGRLRTGAAFAARHNNVFQGLAADGAKVALWKVWRAGYRIVNFVHDQLLVEVPADSDLARHARRVTRLMVAGMREVTPDVLVKVRCVATTVWSKDAVNVTDAAGRLVAWSPAP